MDPDTIKRAILYLIAFVLCIAVHEFGHAWVATRLGDPTPRSQGRLTLNPLHHADPIGTILMPLMSAFVPGVIPLAWGRPVITNPLLYTRKISRSTADLLVAIAGPGMNLLMAAVVSAGAVLAVRAGVIDGEFFRGLFRYLIALNLVLMFFNLLPLHPLDGGKILDWLLPPSLQFVGDFFRRFGFLIFFALLLTGALRVLMTPAYRVIDRWYDVLLRLAAG